ncbi:hypothetical protein [Arthrobacter tecti]
MTFPKRSPHRSLGGLRLSGTVLATALALTVAPITASAIEAHAPAVDSLPPAVTTPPVTGGSGCTLAPPANELSEAPVSCIKADVVLDKVPTAGETTDVTVTIESEIAIEEAQLQIRLPQGLSIVSDGFSAPAERGLDTVATQNFALNEDGRTVTFTVKAEEAGAFQVQADVIDVKAPADERFAHSTEEITVGKTADTSKKGVSGTKSQGHNKEGDVVAKRNAVIPQKDGTAKVDVKAAAGEVCATGNLTYHTFDGAWHPGKRFSVSLMAQKTADAPATTLATGLTGAEDGTYELCGAASGAPLAAMWVQFSTQNASWEIVDMTGENPYVVASTTLTNVPTGTTQAIGTTSPSALHMPAFDAYDVHNKIYDVRGSGTDCWTAEEDTNCSKIKARWAPGNTNGGYYSTDPQVRSVFLTDAMPDARHPVVHEAGHNFQHLIYNWYWPSGDCPSPHSLHRVTGPVCAWTEGFPNAIAGYVMGDERYYYNTDTWIDLTQPGFQDNTIEPARPNMDNGDSVEGRVAGAMIELWKELDGGPESTFRNMDQYVSDTFDEWFNVDRPKSGLDSGKKARDILYNHSIDYRDVKRKELVTNGSLEDQGAGWAIEGGVVGSWGSFPAFDGRSYAWMGGNGVPNVDSLSQTVTIPKRGTSLLHFMMRIQTTEPRTEKADKLELQVIAGGVTNTVYTWWNSDFASAYSDRVLDLSQFAGQEVELRLVSTEDDGQQTNFVLDSISLYNTK